MMTTLKFQSSRAYTHSKYQRTGTAQSVYITQGFSPVTFMTETNSTMGMVEKKR